MAKSFIKYRNSNIIIHDNYVTIIAKFLIKAARQEKLVTWQKKMIDDLIIISLGAYSGCKNLYLNEYLESEFRIKSFIGWIEKAKNELDTFRPFLTKEYLNSLEYFEQSRITWVVDLEVDLLIGLLENIKEMILKESHASASL
ncbi:MAG: hypothetical protein R2774_01460 [Saprospiraceae bacterium]